MAMGGVNPVSMQRASFDTVQYAFAILIFIERVQRLINIRIAKAYHTVSNEALCILTGLTPIAIKIDEASQFYQLTKGSKK